MSDFNNENTPKPWETNPVVEQAVVETPVEEAPVAEPVVVEAPVEAPAEAVVEAPSEPEVNLESAITPPVYTEPAPEVQGVGFTTGGAIGVTTTRPLPRKSAPVKPKSTEEKVALYSTKNVTWAEVGKVYRGYNIVSKSAADKWLTRDHIRVATPDEVAREFGK
jgi:hypothetical protein